MRTFNYRLVQYKGEDGIGIHEVHYEDGKPVSYCESPVIVGNDLEDLKGEVENLFKAFNGEVLNEDIFK